MLSKRLTTNKQTRSGSAICARLSCAPAMVAQTTMLLLLFASSAMAQANLGTISLVNSFETAQDMAMITTASSVSLAQVTDHVTDGKYALQATFQVAAYPTIQFDSSKQPRDWSAFGGLAFDVYNPTSDSITLKLRIDDDTSANGSAPHSALQTVMIGGHSGTSALFLFSSSTSPFAMGMQAGPPVVGYSVMQVPAVSASSLNWAHITSFYFYLTAPQVPETLILDNVRLFSATADSLISYVGIVDQYGQFTKESWPGKVASDSDLTAQAQAEAKLPLPDRSGLDQYGGTLALPAVTANGFFRTTKDSAGRWWLVTPTGHLFFSRGIDGIRINGNDTDVQGRTQMFTSLPAASDPLATFYVAGTTSNLPVSSGIQLTTGQAFNFYGANLYRKYGSGYQQAWNRSMIDRLTRWGVNTIADFSNPVIFPATGTAGQRVPYTPQLSSSGTYASVTTPYDYWGHMPDPFDPAFAKAVDSSFATQIASTYPADPYLLGYFVDNELQWAGGYNDPADQSHFALVYGALAAGAGSPAKNAFLQALQKQYGDIAKLNQAWQTSFGSWDSLLNNPYSAPATLPTATMRQDFSALLLSFAEQYFRTIGTTIKKYDPHHLYLGSKFAWYSVESVQACSEYCDVISYDDYTLGLDPVFAAVVGQFN